MKIIGMALMTCLLSFSSARAEVKFGLRGGFQLATMDFSSDALAKSNRMGFSVGPVVHFGLPVPGLSVNTAMLFDQRDLKVNEDVFQQKSLVLRGDARYNVGIGDVANIFFLAGPQFSFNVGDDVIHWFSDDGEIKQFSLQETMLGFNLGAGVTLFGHLEGAVTYNIPVSKTADFTWQKLSDQLIDQTWNHAKSRTNAWNISVTYYF